MNGLPSQSSKLLQRPAAFIKKRLNAGKNTPVFSALTNGTDFRFFAIDTDGVVYAMIKKSLNLEKMELTSQALHCLLFFAGL